MDGGRRDTRGPRRQRRYAAPRRLRLHSGVHRASAIERLEPRTLLAANEPYISEFLAVNSAGIVDRFGEHSDWIEIHNPGPAAIDLPGWRLTDARSDPAGWTFPSTP